MKMKQPSCPTENANKVANIISPGSSNDCRDDENHGVLSENSIQPEREPEENIHHQGADEVSSRYAVDFMNMSCLHRNFNCKIKQSNTSRTSSNSSNSDHTIDDPPHVFFRIGTQPSNYRGFDFNILWGDVVIYYPDDLPSFGISWGVAIIMNKKLHLIDGATFPTEATLDMMVKVYRWNDEADSFQAVIPQTGEPWKGWMDISSWMGLEDMMKGVAEISSVHMAKARVFAQNCVTEYLDYVQAMRKRGRRVRRNFDVMDSAFTPNLNTLLVSSLYSPEIISFIGRNSPFHEEPHLMLTAMFQ